MKERVILCVDDEEIVLRSLQRELNDALDNAYLIETADSGQDALELFDELEQDGHEVPLMICDRLCSLAAKRWRVSRPYRLAAVLIPITNS